MADLTLSERMVKSIYEAQGWKVLRHGAPDFVFYKEKKNGEIGDVVFVEVKGLKNRLPSGTLDTSKYRKLEPNQELYRKILLKLGAKYRIEPFDTTTVPEKGTMDLRNLRYLNNFIADTERRNTTLEQRLAQGWAYADEVL